MRFITLSLIAWLFATALIAQTSQVTSQPMPNADSLIADVLSPLDLDQVPSGFLYDRDAESMIATELPPAVSYNQCSHLRQAARVFVDPKAYTADGAPRVQRVVIERP